jgi:type II secretory pathway pseudopilin PulG
MFVRRIYEHQRERGDTVVEVLIAVAVVAVVLGGAYVTTNRNLLAVRSSQERVNALKLAESQIEQIKGLAATDPEKLFTTAGPNTSPNPFCIAKSSGLPVAADNAACAVDLSGDPAPAGVEPRFSISITRTGNDFVLTERWTDVSGQVTDELQLRYRVYGD